MGLVPPKPPRKPPRKSDQGIKDSTCDHCGRLVPAGVYTCAGCGAPRMGVEERPTRANVVVDVSGVGGVVDDVDAFVADLVKEFEGCGNAHANIILMEDDND